MDGGDEQIYELGSFVLKENELNAREPIFEMHSF